MQKKIHARIAKNVFVQVQVVCKLMCVGVNSYSAKLLHTHGVAIKTLREKYR